MSAYLLFIRDRLRDADLLARYTEQVGPSLAGHPIEPLVMYGAVETLEGAEADGVVVARFPDADAAKAWYNSPAYAEARKLRFQGSDYRVILVNGIDA